MFMCRKSNKLTGYFEVSISTCLIFFDQNENMGTINEKET